MNLAKRAREAAQLSSAAFAEMIGVSRPQVSRWERTGKWPAVAEALFQLILAAPSHSVQALRQAKGLESGYAGDGGPPPPRRFSDGPMVDEYGFPLADGERQEPDLGFEPGIGSEVGAFGDDDEVDDDAEAEAPALTPAARFDHDDELLNEDELVGAVGDDDELLDDDDDRDPDEVPDYRPTF